MRLTFPCFLRLRIVSIRLITKTQERKPQVREMCLRDKGWCSVQKAQDFIDNAKQFLRPFLQSDRFTSRNILSVDCGSILTLAAISWDSLELTIISHCLVMARVHEVCRSFFICFMNKSQSVWFPSSPALNIIQHLEKPCRAECGRRHSQLEHHLYGGLILSSYLT